MSKKSKSPGVCVFCGAYGVTKQHMWPDWLKKVVPRIGATHIQSRLAIDASDPITVRIKPTLEEKRGPIGTKKIRKMCAKCNGGWMGKIEENSIEVLSDLIRARAAVITPAQKNAIAAWSALISIVAEYTDEPSRVITESHRRYLMEKRLPPPGWNVWIGVPNGESWTDYRYLHFGARLGHRSTGKLLPNEENGHFSSFGIGALFIHVRALPQRGQNAGVLADVSNSGLLQIWPLNDGSTSWPPAKQISDAEANEVAHVQPLRMMAASHGQLKPN